MTALFWFLSWVVACSVWTFAVSQWALHRHGDQPPGATLGHLVIGFTLGTVQTTLFMVFP